MIGNKMLLYDSNNDRFFAGWRAKREDEPKVHGPASWCKQSKYAFVFYAVAMAYKAKEELGIGVRIVTEKEVKKIDAMRETEVQNDG